MSKYILDIDELVSRNSELRKQNAELLEALREAEGTLRTMIIPDEKHLDSWGFNLAVVRSVLANLQLAIAKATDGE